MKIIIKDQQKASPSKAKESWKESFLKSNKSKHASRQMRKKKEKNQNKEKIMKSSSEVHQCKRRPLRDFSNNNEKLEITNSLDENVVTEEYEAKQPIIDDDKQVDNTAMSSKDIQQEDNVSDNESTDDGGDDDIKEDFINTEQPAYYVEDKSDETVISESVSVFTLIAILCSSIFGIFSFISVTFILNSYLSL